MDNRKFTKGKWVHSGINGVHNERGNCVAISEGETVEQRRANALLISKAPEMLEMLQHVSDKLNGNGFPSLQFTIDELIKEATEF